MSTKVILQIIIAVFVLIIILTIYYFRNDLLPQKNQEEQILPTVQDVPESSSKKDTEMSVDRITTIEKDIIALKNEQDNQSTALQELSKKKSVVSTPEATTGGQRILATAKAQGSLFTTASNAYTPMSVFVNIICSKQCILWINFYSSSRNSSTNNVNTYGIFLDGQDKNIYSQANVPLGNGSTPISLNAALPVNAGTHTVEIQAKTTGGTLQSDISFLQVMAIEQ